MALRRTAIGLGLAAGWVGAVHAQERAALQGSPRPDAGAVLRELELDRRTAAPVAPAAVGDRKLGSGGARINPAVQRDPLLWPEDFQISMRTGRVRQLPDTWEFVFSADEAELAARSVRLLPNSKLHQMVNFVQSAGQEDDFVVTGRITEYRGANYLLVRDVSISSLKGQEDPKPAKPAPGVSDGAETPAEGVMEQLARTARSVRPLQRGPEAGRDSGAAASETSGLGTSLGAPGGVLPEDARVENRPGRLVRDGQGWSFAYESNSDRLADPPLRLLPNLTLQTMEEQGNRGAPEVVFIVSGEVTEYGGVNYLLARRFMIRRPDVNFR